MPAATPGLADLSAAVLKLPIRQGENAHHSAVEDAAASLALAQYQIDHGTVLPLPPPELKVPPLLLLPVLLAWLGVIRGVMHHARVYEWSVVCGVETQNTQRLTPLTT